jgi:hypothetical protein
VTIAGLGCSKASEATGPVDPAATVTAEPAEVDVRPEAPRIPAATSRAGREAGARVAESRRGSAPPASAGVAHPLAAWMRGPATDALDSGNLEAIARTFEQMAAWAPKDYTNWASISVDGAEAARVGHIDAVKAACRGCHSQYEAGYKSELSTRPL